MFDISFVELALVGVVALLVIGPKKLPDVARTAGRWIGKIRRMIANAKADMDREFKTDELRKLLTQQQGEMQELRKILDETRSSLDTDVNQLGVNLADNAVPAESPGATGEVKPDSPALPADTAPQTLPHDGQK